MKKYDVVIVGGGMVGMAAAVALATAGIHSAVIERIPHPAQLNSQFDGRTAAISLGTKRLMDSIGAWEFMAPHAQPINDIRVVDGDSSLFLHYDHREVGNEPFGWIIENRIIREALFKRGDTLKEISIFAPHSAEDITITPSSAQVTLDDGQILQAPLLIAADGKFSAVRKKIGIATTTIPYNQTALVCTIAHSEPHNGLALERFLPIGPFAVLPMQHNRSSLVWTESADSAAAMLQLNDEDFAAEITRRVGSYLGEISLAGPRFSYPLTLVHAEHYTTHRAALVGDAAHGIHPIAGQGVNLGFRDVAALTEILCDAKRLGGDIGFETTLAAYNRWRALDAFAMVSVTDGLTRLFSNNIVPLRIARRLGLGAVGKMPPVKRFFMRHAMGLEGDLPKLMRGETL
ncbi:MAG: 2-octaprenyl-6-methoxyphenyl hydroxylase [Alphaproteobacteria bacterium]|nr:2-octaprenyl-6-methoxyphenyl hydroxylase [Alphaproteobacteria bacterium]